MDLIKVSQRFKSENDCRKFLASIRWPDGVKCVYCLSTRVYARSCGSGFKCSACNCSFSVTTGTILHATKLPLFTWFVAIAQIVAAKKGISSLQLSRTLAVNKNTAWYMQFRIRQAIKSDVLLKGIVEADETYIGGALRNMPPKEQRKRNPFRSGMVHKVAVLGMVERESGKGLLKILKHNDGINIKPILKRHIDAESELVTDGFGGYYGLDKHFSKHIKMNHEKGKRKEGIYNLSRIEGFFTMIKRAVIGQYHRIDRKHLQSYMDEIAFKKNVPPEKAFLTVIQGLCAVF